MNLARLSFGFFLVAFWPGAGCSHIDVSASGNSERVLSGVVNAGSLLPAGAEVLVRVIAATSALGTSGEISSDTPVATRAPAVRTEHVLGEQVQRLAAATVDPVPFRVEYTAEDAVLRRGVNVEVRISVAGKVRFRTIRAFVVTLASSPFRQEVSVQSVVGN